jgi:hypothetical protein
MLFGCGVDEGDGAAEGVGEGAGLLAAGECLRSGEYVAVSFVAWVGEGVRKPKGAALWPVPAMAEYFADRLRPACGDKGTGSGRIEVLWREASA